MEEDKADAHHSDSEEEREREEEGHAAVPVDLDHPEFQREGRGLSNGKAYHTGQCYR